MSITSDVLTAVAVLLDAEGIGTWAADSVAAGGLPAIVMKRLPTQPDRCVILNLVTNGDSRAGDTVSVMVQVRTRGAINDPFDADDIADAVFPVLNSIEGLVAGDSVISQLTRRTSVQNGVDANGRYERIDQFYGDVGTLVATDS